MDAEMAKLGQSSSEAASDVQIGALLQCVLVIRDS